MYAVPPQDIEAITEFLYASSQGNTAKIRQVRPLRQNAC